MKRFFSAVLCLLLAAALCGCNAIEGLIISGSDAGDDYSGSDEQQAVWAQAADDEEYLKMMNEKLNEYIICLTTLNAEKERLSALESEKKIQKDEQYIALNEEMLTWCAGAAGYPVEALSSQQAQEVCNLLHQLAETTAVYLEAYPKIAAEAYEGEPSAEELENQMIEYAVAASELLD